MTKKRKTKFDNVILNIVVIVNIGNRDVSWCWSRRNNPLFSLGYVLKSDWVRRLKLQGEPLVGFRCSLQKREPPVAGPLETEGTYCFSILLFDFEI